MGPNHGDTDGERSTYPTGHVSSEINYFKVTSYSAITSKEWQLVSVVLILLDINLTPF